MALEELRIPLWGSQHAIAVHASTALRALLSLKPHLLPALHRLYSCSTLVAGEGGAHVAGHTH